MILREFLENEWERLREFRAIFSQYTRFQTLKLISKFDLGPTLGGRFGHLHFLIVGAPEGLK